MKGDIDELKRSVCKIMEMMQALNTKEDQPQRTMISQINGLTVYPYPFQRVNTSCPQWVL